MYKYSWKMMRNESELIYRSQQKRVVVVTVNVRDYHCWPIEGVKKSLDSRDKKRFRATF